MTGLLCVVCTLVTPGAAWAVEDPCQSAGLVGAEVGTSVRLEHDNRTYTRVVTELRVDVPATWPPAYGLLLSADSRPYITAMSCLVGADAEKPRWWERLAGHPIVTAKDGRIEVVHEAYGWVDDQRQYSQVGLWQFWSLSREQWTVQLMPPPALWGARWDEITVDPGGPGAEWAQPEIREGKGSTALVWRPGRVQRSIDLADPTGVPGELTVSVWVRPPWQRSWAAWSSHPIAEGLDFLGVVLWVSTYSALLLMAVRRYRGRPGTPTDLQSRALSNLKWWTLTAAASCTFAAADDLVERYLGFVGLDLQFGQQQLIQHGFAWASACALFGFARPPRRVRWAALAVALVALACIVPHVVIAASLEKPVNWETEYGALEIAVASQTVNSFCLVGLLLLGFAAAAWRLAADGRLLPKSRRFPGRDRVFRMRVAGPSVFVATSVMALCFALVEEQNWQQSSRLMDRTDRGFGQSHREGFLWEALWSVSNVEDWLIVDHGRLLTSLAVIAVLRTWHDSTALSPLHDWADRLPLLVFFPLAVGLDTQNHLDNALLEFLWIPLYMLALFGVTALLARRSVLAQPFEISRRPCSTAAGPAARRRLLDKARSYREIHAELRRLDQGLFGDVPPKRDALERRLKKLHDWRVNSAPDAAPDRLPARVSVVDVALALGPRDDWWGNGVRGARFALVPGMPAAVLNTWSEGIRGEGWQNTLDDLLGFPSLAITLVSWTAMFAGAGFVLGALWRVLPGRRGAVKALPVATAFAVPVGLDVLVARLMRESAANVALYVLTMLFVLTVTGIALDLDTFAGERRYWQTRLGLLLSVYQMRYYSLQVAYLIGQIIAIITIWQFFAEPDAVPSGGEAPPSSSNEGAGG
ncbi:DUF6185 family protein [Streptomyces sp. NBC_00487]|uniref:DUF6185 family protein n=1 Tax=unclassified Streptomyces TaxID=2593676 RepID=UPI002E184492